jgi:hypothetical protein
MENLEIIYNNEYCSSYNKKAFMNYIDKNCEKQLILEINKHKFLFFLKKMFNKMIYKKLINYNIDNNDDVDNIISGFMNIYDDDNNNDNKDNNIVLRKEIKDFINKISLDNDNTNFMNYHINYLNYYITNLIDCFHNLDYSVVEIKEKNKQLSNTVTVLKEAIREINMTNYIYSSSCVCLVLYNLFNYFFI